MVSYQESYVKKNDHLKLYECI